MIESIQQEKAILCKQLGELVMKVPPSICNGSVQLLRQWKEDRAKAEKVIRNKKANTNMLKSTLSLMEKYK